MVTILTLAALDADPEFYHLIDERDAAASSTSPTAKRKTTSAASSAAPMNSAPMAAMVISASMVKGEPERSAATARFATGATPIRHAARKAQWAIPGEASSLTFIRPARELGFPLDAIRDLLSLSDRPDQSCAAVDAIASAQLVAVEARIARLMALKAELQRMVTQCAGGRIADCHVIEVLGDHSLCEHDHSADALAPT